MCKNAIVTFCVLMFFFLVPNSSSQATDPLIRNLERNFLVMYQIKESPKCLKLSSHDSVCLSADVVMEMLLCMCNNKPKTSEKLY